MPRNSEAKTRRHIWMYDEDWDKIGQLFGDSLGHSGAVQSIIRAFLKKIESKAERNGKALSTEGMDLDGTE